MLRLHTCYLGCNCSNKSNSQSNLRGVFISELCLYARSSLCNWKMPTVVKLEFQLSWTWKCKDLGLLVQHAKHRTAQLQMRTETRRTQCCVCLVSRHAVVLFNTKYPKLPNFLCTGFIAVLPVHRDSTKLFHCFNALQSATNCYKIDNLNH